MQDVGYTENCGTIPHNRTPTRRQQEFEVAQVAAQTAVEIFTTQVTTVGKHFA